MGIKDDWKGRGLHHMTVVKLVNKKLTPEKVRGMKAEELIETYGFKEEQTEGILKAASTEPQAEAAKDAPAEEAPTKETAPKEPKTTASKPQKESRKKREVEEEDISRPKTLAEKQKIIDKFVKEGLVKRASDPDLDYGRVSWGLTVLDAVTGGGPPKGKFTLISGEYQSGKSATALTQVASVHRDNPEAICIWLDAENSFDQEWAQTLGVDLERLIIIPQMLAEDMFMEVERIVPHLTPELVTVDSIGSLLSWQEVKKDRDDKSFTKPLAADTMALTARFLGKLYRRFTPLLRKYQPAFVFITHIYAVIGQAYASEDAKGGNAMKHHTHLWIWTSRRKGDQDKKQKIKMPDGRVVELFTAYEVVYLVKKTRQSATEGHKVAIPFVYGKGLSEMDSVIEMAISMDIVKTNHTYYTHPSFMPVLQGQSNNWVNGRDNTIQFIKANEPVFQAILADVGIHMALEDAAPEDAEVEELIDEPDPE